MPRVKQIVGLDLGARNIRAVWVQVQNGQPRVLRTEKMELPLEGNDTSALIRAWLEQQGLLRGFAAVAISGTQLVFQPGRLTPDDPRTPRQAAEMELARFNDMVGDIMVCDVTAHNRPDSSRQYLMSMARPAVINESLSTLEPLSVRPTDLVPAPAALFCGLSRPADADSSPRLYIDVGYSKTEIAIGTSNGILFARSFPMGGKQFTDAVAKGGAVTVQQAEAQIVRDGTLAPNGPYAEFLTPIAERWYAQLSAVLAAYRSAISGNGMNIVSAIMTGGGSKLRGFREWVAKRSGIEVNGPETLTPPAGLSDYGSYAIALGLAYTTLELPGYSRLSLIPESLRDEVVFKEKKPYWIATAITFALALGVFTAGLVYTLSRESRRLEAERQELRKREKIDNEITKIREETAAIRKEAAPVRRLLIGGPASRYAISLVATSIAPEDWISMIADEETYMRTEAPQQSAKDLVKPVRPGFFVPGFRDTDPKAKETNNVFADAEAKPAPGKSKFAAFIIEGYTPNMSLGSVKDMMVRIRGGERVKSVDLLSDDKVKEPAELPDFIKQQKLPEMRRFVIRMEIAQP